LVNQLLRLLVENRRWCVPVAVYIYHAVVGVDVFTLTVVPVVGRRPTEDEPRAEPRTVGPIPPVVRVTIAAAIVAPKVPIVAAVFIVPPVVVKDEVVSFSAAPVIADAIGSREAVAVLPFARPIAVVVAVFVVADLISFWVLVVFVNIPRVLPVVLLAIDDLAIFRVAILELVGILVVFVVLVFVIVLQEVTDLIVGGSKRLVVTRPDRRG
jgi:hypothetical protein